MPARRCTNCDINYETGPGRLHCPECGDALIYSSVRKGDTPWPPVVKHKLEPLTDEVRAEMVLGWRQLRAELRRRGPSWSMADCIEDFPRADETAA